MRNKVLILVLILFLGLLVSIITITRKSNNGSLADLIQVEGAKTEIPFDKSKWKVKKGWGYAYRNEMLSDLMNDPEVRKLKGNELLDLLGAPDRRNGEYLYYLIEQKRAVILPLHTKTLVIKLDLDSTTQWMKIHE